MSLHFTFVWFFFFSYYRSLNEMYRVAGFCIEDKDYERAFIYYMRFVRFALNFFPQKYFCSGQFPIR